MSAARPRFPLCLWRLGIALCATSALGAISVPVQAEYVTETVLQTEFTQVPDKSDPTWEKIGTGPVIMLGEDGLLLNDNDASKTVAYQGLLGEIEARHRVTIQAEVSILSNIGGDAAVLEIARPGLEVRLRLFRDRVDVVERSSRGETRWLTSVLIDLSVPRQLTMIKEASTADGGECFRVRIDGQEILHCRAQADGSLGVGRVAFGSLSYPGLGASLWHSIGVRLEFERVTSAATPTETTSFGAFKQRYHD